MKKTFVLLMICFFAISSLLADTIIYVSTTGNDNNAGSKEFPLLTVAAGVKRLKEARNQDANSQLKIFIRGGEYPITSPIILDEDLIGSPMNPTIISGYEDEIVSFTGASQLKWSDFKPVRDSKILNRLDKSARNKIVCINLKEKGVKYDDGMYPHGFTHANLGQKASSSMLFVDKQPLDLGRWPNKGNGIIKIPEVIDPGSKPRNADEPQPYRGATFTYVEDRVNRWKQADDIWLYGIFAYGYADDNLRVESIDFNKKTIKTETPHVYGVYSSSDVSDWGLKHSYQLRGYYAYNLLEEIDLPGEYYLDRVNGLLYMYPLDGMNDESDIRLTTYDQAFIIAENTRFVNIENISFEYSRDLGIYLGYTSNIRINNCKFECLGLRAVNMGGIYYSDNKRYPQYADENSYNVVENCYINNVGSGGIYISGGDKKTLVQGNHMVKNCEISNYNLFNQTYCPAIKLAGVGHTINHCYIHSAPHMGIAFQGNDHVIEYNQFESLCTNASDMGAIYIGRNQAEQGTQIRYNYFKDIYKDDMNKVCAIYLDDGTLGHHIYGNIFNHCGNPTDKGSFGAFHVNGGFDNYFDNNIFYNCKQAYGSSIWPDETWNKNITNADSNLKLQQQVDIKSDTYKDRYPTLYNIQDTTSVPLRVNYTNNNIAFRCENFATGSYINSNMIFIKDEAFSPFIDPENGNFNIKTDFRLKEKLPYFKEIPFDRIGLLKPVK